MDNILITMPKNPRDFLLATAVVQAYIFEYVQEVHTKTRDPHYQFAYRMKDECVDFEAPLKAAKDNVPNFDYTGWTVKNRSEFNCFIDFNFEAAEKISRTTGKHITESLGVLVGCHPRKQPSLPPPRSSEGKGVLILNWWEWDKTIQLRKLIPNSHIEYAPTSDSMSEVLAFEIDTAEAVIGPASALTLLAASYNKKLIEIFPDIQSYRMCNNEGINDYQAIVGAPQSIDVDTIISAWNQMSELDLNRLEVHGA
jgi:hypothetical protein